MSIVHIVLSWLWRAVLMSCCHAVIDFEVYASCCHAVIGFDVLCCCHAVIDYVSAFCCHAVIVFNVCVSGLLRCSQSQLCCCLAVIDFHVWCFLLPCCLWLWCDALWDLILTTSHFSILPYWIVIDFDVMHVVILSLVCCPRLARDCSKWLSTQRREGTWGKKCANVCIAFDLFRSMTVSDIIRICHDRHGLYAFVQGCI